MVKTRNSKSAIRGYDARNELFLAWKVIIVHRRIATTEVKQLRSKNVELIGANNVELELYRRTKSIDLRKLVKVLIEFLYRMMDFLK